MTDERTWDGGLLDSPEEASAKAAAVGVLSRAIIEARAAGYAAGVKDEREACAKVCDTLAFDDCSSSYAADRIRARSDAQEVKP